MLITGYYKFLNGVKSNTGAAAWIGIHHLHVLGLYCKALGHLIMVTTILNNWLQFLTFIINRNISKCVVSFSFNIKTCGVSTACLHCIFKTDVCNVQGDFKS